MDINDLYKLQDRPNQSLELMTEEFENYLNKNGVSKNLAAVLKLLYEMDEKPANPLDFMRLHMTEIISEREELEKLREEYAVVMQEIAELQQENLDMTNKLKELDPMELNTEVDVFSNFNGVEKHDDVDDKK